MPPKELHTVRTDIEQWLERCLVGPFVRPSDTSTTHNEEILYMRPSEMYQCGLLYGRLPDDPDLDLADKDLNADFTDEDEESPWENNEVSEGRTRTQKKAGQVGGPCYYRPPSGVGLSFFVSRDIALDIIIKAARYSKLKAPKQFGEDGAGSHSSHSIWQRRPLPDRTEDHEDIITLKAPNEMALFEEKLPILSDHALNICDSSLNIDDDGSDKGPHVDTLHVKWRPESTLNGFIVTISVVNTALSKDLSGDAWEATHLFQLSFECTATAGDIYPYPNSDIFQLDEEERQFALLYSDKTIYAIGHGVSPDWKSDADDRVTTIRAAFLPSCDVPLMKTDVRELNPDILRLSTLAETKSVPKTVQTALLELIHSYDHWIGGLEKSALKLNPDQQITAASLLKPIRRASRRMNEGIRLLSDPMVAAAFSLAHIAMIDYMKTRHIDDPLWRPFQLGFLLQVMPSIIHEKDPDRDLVDLLWFQTGGGKTEAYLAIISFLVTYRRLCHPDDGAGTTVIMRYTLRLLTIQQFQRASVVICALELLRRKHPEQLGDIPITAGLWVGGASSPNSYYTAKQILDNALAADGHGLENLVITQCPWCQRELQMNEDPKKSNFYGDLETFAFICTNPDCDFGGDDEPVLPVNVVDQHLYDHPPTLLLATIDKFAMVTWKKETSVFFGTTFRPPDLIIQDELHLIAGELGTISGLYEAGFDTVFALKNHNPKYIASTATIRNAREQIQKLYARKAAIFPPPGLNWSDSFFAKVDTKSPGRRYIGYFAPKLGRTESFAPLGAALFAAPSIWNETDEAVRDAWWTLVAYHGSLRGLGITHNLIGDEVSKYLNYFIHTLLDEHNGRTDTLAGQFQQFCDTFVDEASPPSESSIPSLPKQSERYKERMADRFIAFRGLYSESGIAELTSNRNAREIRKYLSDLEVNYSHENNRAISLLLCTNMVSVGLDISRLGLMVINGQPFTTGEYIQAGSRVGRGNVPGIVVTHFLRNHARDMSHFENFRAYHESFYRFVEPTSLTPFSAPARQRALHAALVIVMRHGAGLLENDMANRMDMDNDLIKTAVDRLLERCKKASPGQYKQTKAHLDHLLFHWDELSGRDGWDMNPLQYETPPNRRDKFPLLVTPNDHRYREDSHAQGEPTSKGTSAEKEKSWTTLQSMRQVDEPCGIVFVAPR